MPGLIAYQCVRQPIKATLISTSVCHAAVLRRPALWRPAQRPTTHPKGQTMTEQQADHACHSPNPRRIVVPGPHAVKRSPRIRDDRYTQSIRSARHLPSSEGGCPLGCLGCSTGTANKSGASGHGAQPRTTAALFVCIPTGGIP
ncbi:hypothetical protein JOF56_009821 [Kibdelosporangium banguiense]|uniref:Uncharacterized protein n=1 Tax=Kibdelosporangium banguiense TaxID=1365924 RepID=A0ABS4TYI6_9PSEU|nr:hypothetical protein [Kibdelosporangium banguiense]